MSKSGVFWGRLTAAWRWGLILGALALGFLLIRHGPDTRNEGVPSHLLANDLAVENISGAPKRDPLGTEKRDPAADAAGEGRVTAGESVAGSIATPSAPVDATGMEGSLDLALHKALPSQVREKIFPAIDVNDLAERLPANQREVFGRMREEFPNVDWTEMEPTHRAFLDKRSQFPLNLDDEQREAYAAWIGEVEPVSRALIRLRAEAHGLSAGGMEDGRGYYLDGFRDGAPVYVVTTNVGAATTTGVSYVRWNPGFDPALGDTINGGEFYVNVNDHGEIYEHTEFQLPNAGGSRIMVKEVPGYADGNRNHMTHVAGTMTAWGYNASLQGMAPRAWIRALIQQSTWHITTYGMATKGQTMGVTNPRTGNLQLRSVVGNTSLGTADPYNRYDSTSASYDSVLRDYPYYMHFNSTGNSGAGGYETLTGGWKIAKNMIGIGNATAATRDANGVYTGGGTISSTSSRGPTYDGRINPDFVAKGSSVYSTVDTTGAAYYSGTSMSSPNSAGSVALLMDYVRQRLPQQYLRSSTYRALLATTADDRGNPGPDYIYGWGILNIHAAAKILRQQAENPALQLVIEDNLSSSQTWTKIYTSDGTKPIRVSIAWLDPAGAASPDGDRSSRLVNDLDLRLIGPGGTEHRPYVMPFTTGQGATPAFDASLYGAHAVQGDNITDPVEQVYIAAPPAGTYTVRVTHKNSLLNNQAQPFSVAVSGLTNVFGVSPTATFSAVGPQGGPFDPAGTVYTITNNGSTSLAWSVAANPAASWLTINPTSGTIPGSSTATVTVGFNATTDALAGGTYTTDLVFSAEGLTETRPVSLQVRPMTGFVWDEIPSPRYWQSPFSVNLRAVDSTGATIRSFTGTAALTVPSAGAGPVQVGTGTGTWGYPLKTTSHDARTQTIYLSSELGGANQFNSLALNVASTPGQTLTNFTIRMQHTETSAYNNDNQAKWLTAGWTTVYQGNVTISQTGWVEFPFNAPFSYNGTSNLMVDVSFNNTSKSAADGTVFYSTVSNNRSIVYFSDSTNGDPLTWLNNSPQGTRSTNIPNIKLVAPGGVTITPTATGTFTGGVWTGLVTFNEAAESVYLRASSGGLIGDSNAFVVEAKSIPTVTTWPTASAIAYGQAVGDSSLSGGSASVAGIFSFINPSAILPAGTHSVAVIFTPTDTVNYGTVEGMVDLVVTKTTPTVSVWPTASGIVYGQAVSASNLTGGSASTAGGYAFLNPSVTPPTGTHAAAVRFTPTDTANYTTVDGSVNVNVAKATPTVTAWPTAGGIVYGQALSASNLTGGSASTAGHFAFSAPDTKPDAGTYSAAVTFTPTDTTNYNTVGGSVNVAVAKATPIVYTWPTASAIEYGQVVADSSLNGGSASVPGIFVFAEGGAGFGGSDAFTFKVNDGTVNSAPATVDITVGTVGQSSPEGEADPLAAPEADSTETTADRITDIYITCDNGYELYVNGALLGTGNNWQSAQRYQNTPLQVGRNVVAVKGIDAGGVAALLVELVVDGQRIGSSTAWKVSLAAPADWRDPGFDDSAWVAATDYGAYGISPWSKNAAGMPSDTPAKWIWSSNNDADDVVYVRYVIDVVSPNDPPVANPQSVAVARNTPKAITLTGSDPDNDPLTFEIVTPPTYGSLTGTAPNVTYTPPSMLDPGIHNVTVIFIPTEEANYTTVSDTVELEVLPGSTVTVNEWPTASDIVYGDALSASTLSGGSASVDGSFAFNEPATVLNAGTHSVAVTFTPDDTATYNPVSGSVSVTVAKATPVVTAWPTASSIDYGQHLGASTLSGGTATPEGMFTFNDAAVQFMGQDAFTFRVSDGELVSAPATVSIAVGAPAGAPEAGPNAGAPTAAMSVRDDGYTVVTFTEGTGTWTVPSHVSRLEVLVIGGGGGGGASTAFSGAGAGGGGAGGLIYIPEYDVTAGSEFPYAVGTGGGGGTGGNVPGINGTHSVFGVLTALGGGGGSGGNMVGLAGGSGGGSRSSTLAGGGGQQPLQAGLSGTYGFGCNGGAVNQNAGDPAGGGGGAGAAGSGTAGGAGKSVSITGTAMIYAGGGGGGAATTSTPGLGGAGGGGNGGNNGTVPTAGAPNTGGGGGGGNNAQSGARGGDGLVIIAYLVDNLPPAANAQSVTVEPNTPKAITLEGTDPDGDPLTFEIVTPPTYGTLSGTAPNVTYTPPVSPEPGVYPVAVRFTPTDTANYNTVDGTVNVTVIDPNTAPVADAQSVTLVENTPAVLTLTGSDADGDPLTYTVVTGPTSGALSGTAPNLTYTPNANHTGGDAFTFKVNDGTADSAAATVSLSVITAAQHYDEWIGGYAFDDPEADTSWTGSATNDGVSNLIKLTLGLDPTVPVTASPFVTERIPLNGKTHVRVTFPLNPDAAHVVIDALSAGSLDADAVWSSSTVEITEDAEGNVVATDTEPVEVGAPRFLKLRFTLP
jgi:hypothetical protein